MSIIRRNVYWPFRLMDSLFDDLWVPDFTLMRFPVADFPKLDIKEGENDYTITVDAPGYAKEELGLEVKDDMLRIFSEHKEEKEEKKEGYIYKERSERSFSRSLRIPENIKAEDINAALENGVLTLTIPKKEITEPAEPKKIEIKNAEALPEGEIEAPEPEKTEESAEKTE